MPVSKLCVFTGFETGRCLYLWWQIKQSAEIGLDVSVWIVLAIATATVKIHTYFVFYWDILMLGEANWRREICKNCRFYVRWKTFELSGLNWFWFGHLSLPTVNPPVSQWVRETGLPVYKKLVKLVDKMIWPKSSDIVIMSFFVCSICEQWRSACSVQALPVQPCSLSRISCSSTCRRRPITWPSSSTAQSRSSLKSLGGQTRSCPLLWDPTLCKLRNQ